MNNEDDTPTTDTRGEDFKLSEDELDATAREIDEAIDPILTLHEIKRALGKAQYFWKIDDIDAMEKALYECGTFAGYWPAVSASEPFPLTEEPPDGNLPEGWRYTGEIRVPKADEYWQGLSSVASTPIPTQQIFSHSVDDRRRIVEREEDSHVPSCIARDCPPESLVKVWRSKGDEQVFNAIETRLTALEEGLKGVNSARLDNLREWTYAQGKRLSALEEGR